MLGRYYSILFLLSLVLLLKSDIHQYLNNLPSFGVIIILSFMLGKASSAHPLTIRADSRVAITENGIINEKLFFYSRSGWLSQAGKFQPPDFGGPEGLLARQTGKSPLGDVSLGAFGYYAGPHIYIIDPVALTDVFLARIPYSHFDRVGHYLRDLPNGYKQTLENNFENNISDPYLKDYYEKLSVVARGDLFTKERFKLIWEFNTGQYDDLVEKYINTQ